MDAHKDDGSQNLCKKSESLNERVPTFLSQRWILAYLFLTGYFNVYALRVNISVALVCMVRTPLENSTLLTPLQSNITTDDTCGVLDVTSPKAQERGEFDWDKNTRSAILSSFFYGYVFTQIPGGWLADRFGGKRIYGIAMAISGIATLLTPVFARTSVILVYVLRVILGLATGVVFPVGHSMWGRWAPPLERSKLIATSYVGASIGIIGTFAASGLLCEYGFDNGWGSIFYITGGLSCIWTVVWFYQARDSPSEHPRISKAELRYLTNAIEFDTSRKDTQEEWRNVFYVCAVFYLIGIIVFGGFARGEVQSWAKDKDTELDSVDIKEPLTSESMHKI
ncbi:SLC17A5 [Mytilus coruscus]|uniref:SLC17A5 n=1 Tax=Mytilus coruscus TaxID=42192 RepID=A0A6J8EH99_MYTCO|nr:SLC17A5 [Mytilus coruscus]